MGNDIRESESPSALCSRSGGGGGGGAGGLCREALPIWTADILGDERACNWWRDILTYICAYMQTDMEDSSLMCD